jgi:multifunctional methyltransferase subunit TRM112
MVRLITHNLLACHVKGCNANNFPLELKDVQVELREAEFNPDFLRGFMPKIEWQALVGAAKQVLCNLSFMSASRYSTFHQLGDTSLPLERPEMVDDDFLKKLHHVLLEVRDYVETYNVRNLHQHSDSC